MPTYDPTIPTKSASPSTSHNGMKDNYQAALDALKVNHGAFGDPFEGNHEKIYLTMQTDHQIASAESIVIYGKTYTHDSTTTNELWLRRSDLANPIPFTGYGTTHNITGSTTSDISWFYLPTGELIKCGTSSWAGGSGSALVPLNLAGQPLFTNTDSLRAVTNMNNAVGLVTIVQLKIEGISFSTNVAGQICWTVIGV